MPQVRSIFLSDIHLGTRACQADRLLDFLRHHPAENVFLIGDIIDFWSMNRSIHWTPLQNTVVQKILRRARHGERVQNAHLDHRHVVGDEREESVDPLGFHHRVEDRRGERFNGEHEMLGVGGDLGAIERDGD